MRGREPVLRVLGERNFSFDKRLGQNFLTDADLLAAIAADSGCAGGVTVEIGCGAGTLTRELAALSTRVIGFEIDRRLRPVLEVTLGDLTNVDVRFEDFMKADLGELEEEIGARYRVVANLPYYITTPILMKILEEARRALSLTVMVQEEVADRLCAQPGTPAYGAITVAVNLIGSARTVRRVPRGMFTPPPNVDSAVVTVEIDPQKRERFQDVFLRKLVRAAFAMRRKTLVNNLTSALGISRERAVSALAACGLPADIRGERLSAEDFARLADPLRNP